MALVASRSSVGGGSVDDGEVKRGFEGKKELQRTLLLGMAFLFFGGLDDRILGGLAGVVERYGGVESVGDGVVALVDDGGRGGVVGRASGGRHLVSIDLRQPSRL